MKIENSFLTLSEAEKRKLGLDNMEGLGDFIEENGESLVDILQEMLTTITNLSNNDNTNQNNISSNQSSIASLQSSITSLQSSITSLQSSINVLNAKLSWTLIGTQSFTLFSESLYIGGSSTLGDFINKINSIGYKHIRIKNGNNELFILDRKMVYSNGTIYHARVINNPPNDLTLYDLFLVTNSSTTMRIYQINMSGTKISPTLLSTNTSYTFEGI